MGCWCSWRYELDVCMPSPFNINLEAWHVDAAVNTEFIFYFSGVTYTSYPSWHQEDSYQHWTHRLYVMNLFISLGASAQIHSNTVLSMTEETITFIFKHDLVQASEIGVSTQCSNNDSWRKDLEKMQDCTIAASHSCAHNPTAVTKLRVRKEKSADAHR